MSREPSLPALRAFRAVAALALTAVAAAGCSIETVRLNQAPDPAKKPARTAVDHAGFDAVLRRHVSAEGIVDYAALHADRAGLDAYIAGLALVDVEGLASDAHRKAYWINAYNAITLAGILHFHPTKSIKDHSGFWDKIVTNCGGVDRSLNDIEHRILRNMGDPRIHMAIVCASRSCPALLDEAFVPERLDAQLDAQSRAFLASTERNQLDDKTKTARLSKIFDWFGKDFDVEPFGGVRGFVRRYALPRAWLLDEFPIEYLTYDWSLNGPR